MRVRYASHREIIGTISFVRQHQLSLSFIGSQYLYKKLQRPFGERSLPVFLTSIRTIHTNYIDTRRRLYQHRVSRNNHHTAYVSIVHCVFLRLPYDRQAQSKRNPTDDVPPIRTTAASMRMLHAEMHPRNAQTIDAYATMVARNREKIRNHLLGWCDSVTCTLNGGFSEL